MNQKADNKKHRKQDEKSTRALADNSINELKERVKELNCCYEIMKIIKNGKLSVDEALQQIVEQILPSWQFPDVTCARIILKDWGEFKTNNFKKTKWSQISNILLGNKIIGALEVYYLEEKPPMDEGPFLMEERRLIGAVSDLLGKFIEERGIKEDLKQQHKKLDYVEKTMFEGEKEPSSEVKTTEKKYDWEVIINLLIKTDPRTLLRMTRKMIYYLYRIKNEKITNLLNKVFPVEGESKAIESYDITMPNPRQDLDALINMQKQVFEIAKESLPAEAISNLFYNWMKQDKARSLLLTSQKTGIPLAKITDELNRFFSQSETETTLSVDAKMAVKSALIRRFFNERLEYVNVAKMFFEVEDFVSLVKHVVGPPQDSGKLGGKASGVLLAEKIIREEMKKDDTLKDIAFPKSWYISSDTLPAFIHYNDLDEVSHVKYQDSIEITQEQPLLEQIFKNTSFPSEIKKGLRQIIEDFKDKPIIIRSSSLLEDNFGFSFSGKYKNLFVPNIGNEEERLTALMNAIAEIYASTFNPDSIEYRRERGLLEFNEEIGLLIQEVVGTRVGPYYMPAFAGIAFSRNEFRWSPRISREDGMIRLVPGLGTRAVNRVGNDYPILISPKRPNLQVNPLVEERIKYSPRYMDVINLKTGIIETVDAVNLFKEYADQFPKLSDIVSIHKSGDLVNLPNILFDLGKSDIVITFSNLFEKSDFLGKMKCILNLLEEKLGTPVDVEFASDGEQLYILQCRPQSQGRGIERKSIPKNIPLDKKLFTANKYITTGQIENIEYIVYVVPEAYAHLEKREQMQKVVKIVNELNRKLPWRKFILMGPGRWGSRGDIKLGVPVKYRDINNTSLLVEIAKEKDGYIPELSFGTHFFQDLIESEIRYLPLYPDQTESLFREEVLLQTENKLSTIIPMYQNFEDVVHVIKISDLVPGGTLSIIMDGEAGEALAYLKPPDHLT